MGKKDTRKTSVQAKKGAPEKLQALVVWVTGEDAGTYTTGISTEWIKKFDYQEWLSTDPEDENDSLYVVEWRDGPKPLGGWPTYDAKVLEVSANKAVLARAQKRLTEMKSPRLKTPQSKFTDPESLMHPGTSSSFDRSILDVSDKENQEEEYEDFEPIDKKRRLDFEEDINQKREELKEKTKDRNRNQKGSRCDEGTVGQGGSAPITLEGLAKIMGGFQQSLDKLSQSVADKKKKKKKNMTQSSDDDSDSNRPTEEKEEEEKKKVEIGNKGSGVFVTADQWDVIKNKDTFTKLGSALVDALFPMDVLLQSNLKGGKRKIQPKAGEDQKQFKALDPRIVRAIYTTVEKNFPKRFDRAKLGAALNLHLNYLRTSQAASSAGENSELENSEQENH